MGNAIALTRVSTDAQGSEDRAGLPSQRVEIERIASREGLDIVEWVELRGVSGTQVGDDPRFIGLLARLSEPEVEGIVVADFDRLFRRGKFGDYAILDAFADTGSVLFTSDGRVDPSQDTDALLSVIRGELAGMERRRIRDRTMRAKEVLRRAGRHVTSARCLPYAIDYDDGKWSYRPVESEVVREIFMRVLGGERNFSKIGREVGIQRTLIRKILENPIYKGLRRIDKRRVGGKLVDRDPCDVIEHQVIENPIIDPATWDRVQGILQKREPSPRGISSSIYHGLVRCWQCGRHLHCHKDPVAFSYRCRHGCGQTSVRFVDAACDQELAITLAQPAIIALALEASVKPAEGIASVEDLETERKSLMEQRERVVTAYERGLRSLTEADRRTREVDAELRRLDRFIGRAQPVKMASLEETAQELAGTFAEWEFLAPSQRKKIASAAVEWIQVRKPQKSTVTVESISLRIPPTAPHRERPRGARRAGCGSGGRA